MPQNFSMSLLFCAEACSLVVKSTNIRKVDGNEKHLLEMFLLQGYKI